MGGLCWKLCGKRIVLLCIFFIIVDNKDFIELVALGGIWELTWNPLNNIHLEPRLRNQMVRSMFMRNTAELFDAPVKKNRNVCHYSDEDLIVRFGRCIPSKEVCVVILRGCFD